MSDNSVQVVITAQNAAGGAIAEADAQLQGLQQSARGMAAQMAAAGEQADFSMMKARGTLLLLGDDLGVKMPREVRTFVAELPGVGAALNAAFAGVAVFALLDVVVQLTEKVHDWWNKLGEASEAQKEAAAQADALNQALLEQSKQLNELEKQYKTIGLNGIDLTRAKMQELREEIANTEVTLSSLKDILAANTLGVGQYLDNPLGAEALAQVKGTIASVSMQSRILNQELLNLQKEYSDQAAALARAAAQAQLSADKTVWDSRYAVAESYQKLLLALGRTTADEAAAEEKAAEEGKYQTDLEYLNKKLLLLQQDPSKNQATIRETNAQIEALENDHLAKEYDANAGFVDKVKTLWAELRNAEDPTQNVSGQLQGNDAIDRLLQDYNTLGIQGTASLTILRDNAQAAYDDMRKSGVASDGDLAQADQRVIDLNRQLAESYTGAADSVDKSSNSMRSALTGTEHDVGSLFAGLMTGTRGAASAFAQFGASLLRTMDQLIGKMIVVYAWQKILGWVSGALGRAITPGSDINIAPTGAGGVLGTVPGMSMPSLPAFAGGGSMRADELGIVGENGPELWQPDSAGSVIPFDKMGMGGSSTQVNHFDLRGSSVTRQEIAAAMTIAENRAVARAKFESRDMQLRRV